MDQCKLCDLRPPAIGDVCKVCCAKLRIAVMPPSRRPDAPCNRCEGRRFIRVVPPLALTRALHIQRRPIYGGADVSVAEPVGVLETYVCAGCGFVEWYCQAPESIPIGLEYNTDVVEYPAQGPYR